MAQVSTIGEDEFAAFPPLYGWVSVYGTGADVIAQMQQGVECILVGEPKGLLGLITAADMLRAIAGGQEANSLSVRSLMQVSVPTLPWEQRLNIPLLVTLFRQNRVQYLPVIAADGTVLEVLTPADVLGEVSLEQQWKVEGASLEDASDSVSLRQENTTLQRPWLRVLEEPALEDYGHREEFLGLTPDFSSKFLCSLALHYSRQAVERSPNAIFLIDLDGNVLFWNAACESLLGYSSDICGQPVWSLLAHTMDQSAITERIRAALNGKAVTDLEMTYRRSDGTALHTLSRIFAIFDSQGKAIACIFANTDISKQKQTEEHLRQCEQTLIRTQRLAQIGDWSLDLTSRQLTASQETLRILGLPHQAVTFSFETLVQRVHPQDQATLQAWIEEAIGFASPCNLEFRLLLPDGSVSHAVMNGQLVQGNSSQPRYLFGTLQDITTRKEIEYLQQKQAHRHQVMLHVTQRIRQSLELDDVLQTTVDEVRDLFQADRVIVYRFEPNWSGIFRVESVLRPEYSILSQTYDDPCFRVSYVEQYRQGRCSGIQDVELAAIAPCHRQLLRQFNVRANLVVPILAGQELWGLLIVHQCQAPRQWQAWEQEFLQQLGIQVGIAVQQSELYAWAQRLNVELETMVQQRTERLQQANAFEALLKGITDKVRDSLDEQQILQKVVRELTTELRISSCDTSVYDLERQTSTIQYEYLAEGGPSARAPVIYLQDFPEIYAQLMQGRTVHFCWRALDNEPLANLYDGERHYSVLACPLIDSHIVMGDLWLYRAGPEPFDELEVRLVEQIANQCAIAIRQARLYEAAQAQVKDLAHLNRLKDEFLSSVSHELRTPMANVKMATEMLEVKLMEMGLLQGGQSPSFLRYFQILKDECHRELKLINDLLDLSRLDAESEPLLLTTMDLGDWLHHLSEPFIERTRARSQTLTVDIPAALPPLTCDFMYLGRIVGELLNNACKYTPIQGEIQIAVFSRSDFLQIQVCNSGIEIPAEEQERIFERFYRIPSNDPWLHEGTGLGLALVQKLAEQLGGTVTVDSRDGWTMFTVYLFPKLLAIAADSQAEL
ncbi:MULTISPECIES: GAF domain-containing protein [unclassified Leptolyngbya]|uniref:GAF domain-containing protein n=1 Tax=unclassified Leptolyngbya TaxID=2650499 RepID=UPI00168A2B66|nr:MULTISPECIES: GAF domain-containing protein [unclassified Leptolyngbya]MBD1909296.1 GAF domain-containing protein [Leptolyngbya sp. FACHB-8]MBD2153526.1 GAF domain-containing protein [Leptolyngbya sp. FACHB-16]